MLSELERAKVDNAIGWAIWAAVMTLLFVMVCLSGCARFSTVQTDYTYGYDAAKGKQYAIRKIRTKAAAATFFEAKSSLATWDAEQTDSTQGATVGNLNQEATSTNLAPIVEAVAEGVVRGLGKTVVPVP